MTCENNATKLMDFSRAYPYCQRGAIPKETQPILNRLDFTERDCLTQAHQFEAQYHRRHSPGTAKVA